MFKQWFQKKPSDQTATCPNIFCLHCVLHVDCQDDADEESCLDMCGGDPVVSCTAGSRDGEQEVPVGSRLDQEASVYTAEKHRGL